MEMLSKVVYKVGLSWESEVSQAPEGCHMSCAGNPCPRFSETGGCLEASLSHGLGGSCLCSCG